MKRTRYNFLFSLQIYAIATQIAGFYGVHAGFTFVYISLLSILGEQMAVRMRQKLFTSLISQAGRRIIGSLIASSL